jgi:hypothetical protein
MADNLGANVSRVLDPKQTGFNLVLWQQGRPPCDAELNLLQQLETDWRKRVVLSGAPSGWLGSDVNFSKDYVTSQIWSNWFQFGRQRSGELGSIMWANVNGWLIPVMGTRTGTPPGSPDNTDVWNKVALDPPPSNSGDFRADFVFLEVWQARVPSGGPPGYSSLNKPSVSAIYRYGNVEGGASYLPDDLEDPAIGSETTERVQLQYRIRVVKGLIGLATYPEGFDPTIVKAQGAQASPPSTGGYTFLNMRSELGDPGLWRAGDGTANSLGTVDGYVYAVPICVVFRRNAVVWAGDPSQNLNGAFNRNPTSTDRTGVTTFTTTPTLAAPGMTASAVSLVLVSAANIPLPASPASAVLLQIGEELLTYTSVTGNTVGGLVRGVNGTVAEAHPTGSVVTVLSGRPDGLFSDQITTTDILDLRHAVNPNGFNYQTLLQSNLDKLLKGQLRANWKRSGTAPQGIFVSYEDKISATPAGLGVTKLDAPDGIRMIFSDAVVQQPVEFICQPDAAPVIPPAHPPATVPWGLGIDSYILNQSVASEWNAGDQIQLQISKFKTAIPGADGDQIRFLNEVPASGATGAATGVYTLTDSSGNFSNVEVGDVLVIFAGAAAGTYPITGVAYTTLTSSIVIPAATPITYVVRKGTGAIQIRLEGSSTALPQHRFSVTPANPTPTDDLVIAFVGAGAPFPTTGGASGSQVYLTCHVQYGAGRGVSRRPDSLHNITLFNPSSTLLVQPSGIPQTNFPLRTAWTSLWSKFRSTSYKNLVPVTAEAYADLGSKTVVLTPYRLIDFPGPTLLPGTGIHGPDNLMPLLKADGITPKWANTDPLGLFIKTQYATLPRHLVPGWGELRIPILPTSGTTFYRGVNFLLRSKEGAVSTSDADLNPWFVPYASGPLSYAAFSTGDFSGPTVVPSVYNATFTYGGFTFAGSRFYTDTLGLGRQGIELPPYYGVCRLFGVYEVNDYKTLGSPFNAGTRVYEGGRATNLLRQNFSGPVIFCTLDVDGDSTFVLNADALDLSKSPTPIASFISAHYVVEASIFGFDRGSFDLTQPFRLVVSAGHPVPPAPTAPGSIWTILPGPLPGADTALINYSRTPYQGDPFFSQTGGLDVGYSPGPLTSSVAYQVSSSSLDQASLTRPNQKALEVLASTGFVTSLGTGRLSGDTAGPNSFDFRNVGYEDPAYFPPSSGVAARPPILSGALLSSDTDANPEYLGCTERLPLGSLFRDKDFKGGLFSTEQLSPFFYADDTGVGSGVASLAQTKILEQTEVALMPASLSAGFPGDVLVSVDGSTSYGLLTNFRVNRGGSVFVASGDRPGGEVFATYSNIQGTGRGTRVIVGRAFLVRNAPTSIGANQVSAGDELMLAVVTEVVDLGTTPQGATIAISSAGTGEGYAASDLYRLEGHPLIANNIHYEVDPASIMLPQRM